MSCEHEQLNAYVAGALSESERAAVDEHLQGSAACRSELESLRAVADSLEHAFERDRTVLLWTKARLKRRERRRLWVGSGLAAAAAAVLAIILLHNGRAPLPGPDDPPGQAKKATDPEFKVTTAEMETEGSRRITWDEKRGLRVATRIDTYRLRRIVPADNSIVVRCWTKDSRYKLASLTDR